MSDQFEMQETGNNQQAESPIPEAGSREPEAENRQPAAASFHAARCQHIKVNGTQCGSPALKDKQFCYFHSQCRPVTIELKEAWNSGEVVLQAFDDASSIQFTLRQVAQLLLEQKITEKKAGLLLYALQIASSNLKQMQAEKPRPTQVVVDPEKVAETPIGMTPWSASGEGHDPEEEEAEVEDCGAVGDGGESDVWRQRFVEYLDRQSGQSARIDKWLRANPEGTDKKTRAMLDAELRAWAKYVLERVHDYGMDDWGYDVRPPEETPAMVFSAGEERLRNVVKTWEARTANLAASIRGWLKQDLSVEELRKNFEGLADEAEREVKETAEGTEDDPLPPETIQACAEDARYVV